MAVLHRWGAGMGWEQTPLAQPWNDIMRDGTVPAGVQLMAIMCTTAYEHPP